MSTSDSIPPSTRDPALTFPLATLKATFLALYLVGTLFASPAVADSIPIGLTSGQTSRPVNTFMGAGLTLYVPSVSDAWRGIDDIRSGKQHIPDVPNAWGWIANLWARRQHVSDVPNA